MMNRRLKKASAVLLAMTMIFSLAGCVDQSQGKKSSDSTTQTESSTDESDSSKTADKRLLTANRTRILPMKMQSLS